MVAPSGVQLSGVEMSGTQEWWKYLVIFEDGVTCGTNDWEYVKQNLLQYDSITVIGTESQMMWNGSTWEAIGDVKRVDEEKQEQEPDEESKPKKPDQSYDADWKV